MNAPHIIVGGAAKSFPNKQICEKRQRDPSKTAAMCQKFALGGPGAQFSRFDK